MSEHRQRYEDAANAYARERRNPLDRNWRAFLWCATVRPELWERVASFVNLPRATVDWPGIWSGYWSSGEALMLKVAQALYLDDGDVSLPALSALDDDLWGTVVEAMRLHREGTHWVE